LFKGEENLNVFNNPTALNYLIETFSNIRQFDPYYTGDDDSMGFIDFAEDQSRKAYEKAMKSDKQNSQRERELSSDLDRLRRRLDDTRKRLKSNRDNATNYSTKLEDLENSKEASTLLKGINERLKSLYDKKLKIEGYINEDYTIKLLDEMWILCGFSQIIKEYQEKVTAFSKEKRKQEDEDKKKKGKEEAYQEISQSLKDGIVPLSIYIPDEKTMQEMIEDEFCKVCGREAKQGTDAYNFMVDKLNELLKSQQPKKKKEEIPLFQNNFAKELEQKSISLGYEQEELNNLTNTIRDRIEFNAARKIEAKKMQDSIDSEEDVKKKLLAQNDTLTEEQLINAYQNISNWWEFRKDAEKQIVILEKEEKDIDNELADVQKQYDELAKDSVANTYCKIHAVLSKIQKSFKYAKEKNTQDFFSLLEGKANQYLEKLNIDGFYGIIRILKTTDGSAKIALQDKNDTLITNPNQALKTTMFMSVLFAISDLTTIKRDNDYPLIFDAPTSSFTEGKKVDDFYTVISDIKKQCIIFTKSFLIDDANGYKVVNYDKIKSLKGTVYRMEKQRPFDDKDLSTIQIVITPIK
jgi:DNA sulfur modification protein DndD